MLINLTDDRRKVGGVALGGIQIGNSAAEYEAKAGAILNVAQDLVCYRHWPDVETMHVGLIDGPGNEPTAYCAAVFALHALLKRHNVLVCCHSGSRSLAVSLMYLCATGTQTWEVWLQLLQERVNVALPEVNAIHRQAFNRVADILDVTNWS